ncbi:hypothetical protein LPJ61_001023 [Coemansia biformis]|uniref:Carbohydrate kinase PfkB domain-containing protein n=1 Tax=Coemansia biformis TaxID=1286918 RepID=A0A9W8D001_9FUNG|nr:hypothetical protein LPJ61_001023 [Coemansia biformis]
MRAFSGAGRLSAFSGRRVRRLSSTRRALSSLLCLSQQVKEALANGEPVVALESTIISHGMPYPQNVETAREVEAIVSAHGATPATVALIDGRLRVGLGDEELVRIGRGAEPVTKTSRRDMAAVLSQRVLGATTVSGTMIAAHLAGIRIFATGGIGGVHRGAEATLDVSADLTELGRTPVAVVCAGAKAILDLPKTLEYLETQGVPVVAYGNGGEFPAFYSAHSGLRAPWCLDTPAQVAQMVKSSTELGLQSGMVVAVPIPAEHAQAGAEIERAVDIAVGESNARGVTGKECTPFLLRRVAELTQGASLVANIALVKNNARVASQIAGSLAAMDRQPRPYSTRAGPGIGAQVTAGAATDARTQRPLLVVGGAAVDIASQIDSASGAGVTTATSYPGTVLTSVGGVGQNIARAARLLGATTALVSALGQDAYGQTIASELATIGVDTRFLQYPGGGARTAVYSALHGPDGDLVAAVADMAINGMVSEQHIEDAFRVLNPCVVGLDANMSALASANVLMLAHTCGSCVVFEPTSVPKCTSVLGALSAIKRTGAMPAADRLVHVVTPNQLELRRLAEAAVALGLVASESAADAVDEVAEHSYALDAGVIRDALTLFPLFPVLIVKLGKEGAAVVSPSPKDRSKPVVRHMPPLVPARIANSNGAGDSLVGAVLAMLHRRQTLLTRDGHVDITPRDIDSIVRRAQRASILALESTSAISDRLDPKLIDED